MDLIGPYFFQQPMLAWGLRLSPPVLIACAFIFGSIFYLKKPKRLSPQKERIIVSALSAIFSALYFSYYLHSSPQIIDAAFYFLEAKLFAHGELAFPEQAWASLLNGRFTLAHFSNPQELSVLFPPGYPLILSLFVRIGIPFACGPVLAASITYSTMALGQRLTGSARVGLISGILSTGCLALRYQTADTMSHGLSCLLGVICLLFALDFKRSSSLFFLGILLGFSISTRQLTGCVLAFSCAILLFERKAWQAAVTLPPGILVGALPLLFYNRTISGDFFTSAQTLYYQLADAPEQCFGLGLYKGCVYEHGAAVKEQGGNGLSILWMLRTTFHRIWWLSLDLFSFELLFPLALWGVLKIGLRSHLRGLLAWLITLVASYALFYFNGSIAGGGARLFSELLPLLHVGLAAQLLQLKWEKPALILALLSFIMHGQWTHNLLETSAHHLEPRTQDFNNLQEKTVTLVAPSDHSFALWYLPSDSSENYETSPSVIRTADNARLSEFQTLTQQTLTHLQGEPYLIENELDKKNRRPFEAEASWPLTQVQGVAAHPTFITDDCVPSHRGLLLSFKGTRDQSSISPRPPARLQGYFTAKSEQTHLSCQIQLWTEGRGCFTIEQTFENTRHDGSLVWESHLLQNLDVLSSDHAITIDHLDCTAHPTAQETGAPGAKKHHQTRGKSRPLKE